MKWTKPKQMDAAMLVLKPGELIGLEDRLREQGKWWSVCNVTKNGYEVRVYEVKHQQDAA